MAKKLPVDFEKKIKQPPPLNGKGYPYQLSAKDLMANFTYLLGLMPDGLSKNDIIAFNGIDWVIHPAPAPTGDFTLQVADGILTWDTAASGLPAGSAGDMLYHDGSDWVLLQSPSAPGSGELVILAHTGTLPVWTTILEQDLDICESGTPSTITVLKT